MAYWDSRPDFDDDIEEDYCQDRHSNTASGGMNIVINGQRIIGGGGYSNQGLLPNNICISSDSNSEIIINGQRIIGNNFPRAQPYIYIDDGERFHEMPETFRTVPMQCEDDTQMSYESVDRRLETFKNFPLSVPVSPPELAGAGFFYTGTADMVQCFICNGKIRDWEPGDSAFGEHLKFFPRCEFVRRQMDA